MISIFEEKRLFFRQQNVFFKSEALFWEMKIFIFPFSRRRSTSTIEENLVLGEDDVCLLFVVWQRLVKFVEFRRAGLFPTKRKYRPFKSFHRQKNTPSDLKRAS